MIKNGFRASRNGDIMFNNLEKHPCYGMLGFSRRSGGAAPLFGSSIQHRDVICMTLKHGELGRHLNNDRYFGKGTIAEVEMSYSQFAEAITAMNIGDGVPCTIRFTEKDGYVKDIPLVSKQKQFEQEFADHLTDIKQEASNAIDEVKEIFEKKSIGKRDKEQIIKKLEHLAMQIGANTEFVYRQFNEQMDKTVMEAKMEVEAFCQNKMNSIAQAALVEHKDEFQKLENPVDIE